MDTYFLQAVISMSQISGHNDKLATPIRSQVGVSLRDPCMLQTLSKLHLCVAARPAKTIKLFIYEANASNAAITSADCLDIFST